MKSDEEIMEILEAFDLTGSYRDAGELAGCSHHTVAHYVEARGAGRLGETARRDQLIDPFLAKFEEWVEASNGKVRADVAHDKLVALGYRGSERTTRRAVAAAKKAYVAGRRRIYRPWVPEPGMWFQFDFGDGPLVCGVKTWLFCAWLSWSRFRVVLPDLGQDAADGHRLHRRHAAPVWWLPDVRVDRQREDGDHRACGPDPDPQRGHGRSGRPLRADGRDLCGGRPRVEGRLGGHGAYLGRRPGPLRRQPAGRL